MKILSPLSSKSSSSKPHHHHHHHHHKHHKSHHKSSKTDLAGSSTVASVVNSASRLLNRSQLLRPSASTLTQQSQLSTATATTTTTTTHSNYNVNLLPTDEFDDDTRDGESDDGTNAPERRLLSTSASENVIRETPGRRMRQYHHQAQRERLLAELPPAERDSSEGKRRDKHK